MTLPPQKSDGSPTPSHALSGHLAPNATLEDGVPIGDDGATLSLVCIRTSEGDLPSAVRQWVDADPLSAGRAAQWTAFQGAHIYWSTGRCAILAPAERLEALRKVILEAGKHERELQAIERSVAESWPALESDAPLAFEFNERSVARRTELQGRLTRAVVLQSRLARISPYLLSPLEHPPTLASQVAERMRERLCMASRFEALGAQLDVIRNTYEMCGQRASDFFLARTGHQLELVIIVLLAAQLLLWAFEYLAASPS